MHTTYIVLMPKKSLLNLNTVNELLCVLILLILNVQLLPTARPSPTVTVVPSTGETLLVHTHGDMSRARGRGGESMYLHSFVIQAESTACTKYRVVEAFHFKVALYVISVLEYRNS